MGGGANRFSSLRSVLPHPGPPSSGDRLEGSRTGAGQPKSAWHPPPRFTLRGRADPGATPHCTSSSQPPGSSAGGPPRPGQPPAPWAAVSRIPSPPGAPSQVPAPASTRFLPTLPTPVPSPTATPFHLATRLSSQPTSLPATELQFLCRLSRGNNLYHIYPNVARRPKKEEVHYNVDYF